MDLRASINRELDILKEYGICTSASLLLKKEVKESIVRLGRMIFTPTTTNYSQLKIFCTFIKLRYGSSCLETIRGFQSTDKISALKSFGLFSSRAVISWEPVDYDISTISPRLTLEYLERNIDSAVSTSISTSPTKFILTSLMFDGFSVNSGCDIFKEKLFGVFDKDIHASEAKEILNDPSRLKKINLISSINVFSFINIMNGYNSVIGITKGKLGKGNVSDKKVNDVSHILLNSNYCIGCLKYVLLNHNLSDAASLEMLSNTCIHQGFEACSRCQVNNQQCIRLYIASCCCDQGDAQYAAVKKLRKLPDLKSTVFFHDL